MHSDISPTELEMQESQRQAERRTARLGIPLKKLNGTACKAPVFDPTENVETGLVTAITSVRACQSDPAPGALGQTINGASAGNTLPTGQPVDTGVTAVAPSQAQVQHVKNGQIPRPSRGVTGAVTIAPQSGREPPPNGHQGTPSGSLMPSIDHDVATRFYNALQPRAFVVGYRQGRHIANLGEFQVLTNHADSMHEHLFFHVATLKATWPGDTTADKDHILECPYLWGDCDAEKYGGTDPAAAAEHYASEGKRVHSVITAGLNRLGITPYALWRSGAGWQFLIKLDIAAYPEEAEKLVGKLHIALGFDPVVRNCNRLLRVPGSVNWKNSTNGRVPSPCVPLSITDAVTAVDDMREALANIPDPTNLTVTKDGAEITVDWSKVRTTRGWLQCANDLRADASPKLRAIVGHSGSLHDLNGQLTGIKLIEKPYRSWSEVTFALTGCLKSSGAYTLEQIAEALLADLPCNQHIAKQKDKRRTIERAINRAHGATQVAAASANFRDFNQWGRAKPSLANAVIAIRDLDIKVNYDLFHHRIKLMYNGDAQTIREGLLTDDTVSAVRSLINNTYEIDCGDANTLAALKEIALENAYDPVLDFLDECQGKWDGEKRLETWAVKYLDCEDTPLNRAIGRKMLIAACRRAREPGCKFDNITVLEGTEGTNKSTAIRVLAGDENFSDQSIIGASDKEVQEQLDGIWMHENADLAGMKRADVEQVKAFASRQVDRARPAYGRIREDRPRRSIEWGTTNDDQYLLSQTGNRRIWPLKTGKIDIEAVRREREQLLGEAAAYEAVGEEITLDPRLWSAARDAQEQRRVVDPWEDRLRNMPDFIIHRAGDGYERVASADVLSQALQIPTAQQTSAHGQRLAKAMEHAGWGRNPGGRVTINGVAVRGYLRPSYGQTAAAGAMGLQSTASALATTGPTGPSDTIAMQIAANAFGATGPTGLSGAAGVFQWTPAGVVALPLTD